MTTPRKSKTLTFSLPPEMEAQVRRVMKEDDRLRERAAPPGHPPLHGGAGVAQTGAAGTAALPPDYRAEDTRRTDQ